MWEFFLYSWRFTYLLVFIALIVGFVGVWTIPKESEPDIDIPIAVVSVGLPGAAAEDVEEFVIKPLEDQILGLQHVDEVNAVARRGVASITVQFEIDAKKTEVVADLKDRVDLAKINLPDDATDPIVQSISFSDTPVLTVALSGPLPVAQLHYYAEGLADDIERLPGVSTARVIGGEKRQLSILVDKAALDGFGLTLRQVTDAISLANTDIPVGSIRVADENFTVRFDGGLSSAEEIASVPVANIAGSLVYVKDVASVVDGYADVSGISRLSVDGSEPASSVSLQIYKISGGNVINTVASIWETIDAARPDLPEELVFETVQDNAKQIQSDLQSLLINGVETVLIVMLLLLVFLGWREALLAGVSIPLTFLITFAVLKELGYTLNFLTLFSLILALGIIVDGAIVMMEGMYTELKAGKGSLEAARRTLEQFSAPLIAGTMTTIFAFLPMVLTSGIIGKFIESIPITVSIVLLASIVVALALLPALASRLLTSKGDESASRIGRGRAKLISRLSAWYRGVLSPMLDSKKRQNRFLGVLALLFVAVFALPATGLLEINMFTSDDQPTFTIDIEEPFGTPLDVTDAAVRPIEEVLLADTRLESFLVTIGSSSGGNSGFVSGGSSDGHLAHIIVHVKDDAGVGSLALVDEYERSLPPLTSARVSVSQAAAGPGDAAPVEVRIIGPEFGPMEELASHIESRLREHVGTIDVESSVEETNGEFVLTIDRAKARLAGVSALEVASTLRSAVYGSKAVTIRANGEDVDVLVKYDLDPFSPNEASSLTSITTSTIESLTITSPTGSVPLGSLATIQYAGGLAQVEHLDGDRIIRVTSNVTSETSATKVFADLQADVDALVVPEGYVIEMGGQDEDIQKSFTDMLMAMALGIFLIAALLVWQFSSYRQPFFILATIPLALIGVFPGLVLVGIPLSFPALVGIVALTGIVVNNAIILIDRINSNRQAGMDLAASIQEAAESRLQPILLTTITTVAGLLPLAISSPTWGPLGYSIVFGLMMSTVLTLLVVPVLYLRFAEKDMAT